MKELGLKISSGKSIISYKFSEFAKSLKVPDWIFSSRFRSYCWFTELALAITRFSYSPRVLNLLKQIPGGPLIRTYPRDLPQQCVAILLKQHLVERIKPTERENAESVFLILRDRCFPVLT